MKDSRRIPERNHAYMRGDANLSIEKGGGKTLLPETLLASGLLKFALSRDLSLNFLGCLSDVTQAALKLFACDRFDD